MRRHCLLLIALAAVPGLPAGAAAHPERPSYYPNFNAETKTYGPAFGAVPQYRRTGPTLVVCKGHSASRIARLPRSIRGVNRSLLRRCRFRHIQSAINAAGSNTRILVLPGTYREEPSTRVPDPEPRCRDMTTTAQSGAKVFDYTYHFNCPSSQNLIAVMGDGPDADRRCDRKCNLIIAGTGRDRAT